MPLWDIARMHTAHICWLNRRENEFLSWTSSLLFVLTHAILRHEKGRKDIYLAFGDTRKLQTPAGDQAPFYQTLDLMTVLPYVDPSSLTKLTVTKLHPRHFPHESVSMGEMRDP